MDNETQNQIIRSDGRARIEWRRHSETAIDCRRLELANALAAKANKVHGNRPGREQRTKTKLARALENARCSFDQGQSSHTAAVRNAGSRSKAGETPVKGSLRATAHLRSKGAAVLIRPVTYDRGRQSKGSIVCSGEQYRIKSLDLPDPTVRRGPLPPKPLFGIVARKSYGSRAQSIVGCVLASLLPAAVPTRKMRPHGSGGIATCVEK